MTTSIYIGEPTHLDTILAKPVTLWDEDDWASIKKAIKEGNVVVTKWFPITVPYVAPFDEQTLPYEVTTRSPYLDQREQECAIARFFKEHPNERSVMMTCNCRFCTTWCGS